jgi:ferredoxin
VAQCPVGAISIDSDLPPQWSEWLALNARLSKVWPMITKRKPPLADHAEWAAVAPKRNHLGEEPGGD